MVASHEVDGDMCTNVDCASIPGVLCSDQPLYPTINYKDKQFGEEPDNYKALATRMTMSLIRSMWMRCLIRNTAC